MEITARIGVDLGGTKIELLALDAAGQVLAQRRIATPRGDYVATVNSIADLVKQTEADLRLQGTVGVGTPGSVSGLTGCMKNCNSTWLNGRALKRDLEDALDRQVRLANDANCFVWSEAVDGAAAGSTTVFGVIIGTGTGGGLVVHQNLWAGPNGIAGEWGHNPLPWPEPDELPGPPCYCGKRGCVETFLSGPGLALDHSRRTGCDLTALEIAARAQQGDADALETLERYAKRLAKSLAVVINIVDPEVIVLGGGVSNIDFLYHSVPKWLPQFVFSDSVEVRLAKAKHGDSSGVRGAAWLWKSD